MGAVVENIGGMFRGLQAQSRASMREAAQVTVALAQCLEPVVSELNPQDEHPWTQPQVEDDKFDQTSSNR